MTISMKLKGYLIFMFFYSHVFYAFQTVNQDDYFTLSPITQESLLHPSELFDELKSCHDLKSDSDIARLIGLTPARVSQMRTRNGKLTARQIATYLDKAHAHGRHEATGTLILPIVEMYPVTATLSKQETKRELLPTNKSDARNRAIRQHLEAAVGIYALFDSLGCPIYVGKTEKQNLWKEMTNAFNRERSNHQTFIVPHPTSGASFSPAWKSPRQPVKRIAYLYNTASFFSAYKVEPALIPKLEALLVRIFCNTLSNKKMEKFQRAQPG